MMVSDTALLGAGVPVHHLGNQSGDCFDSLGSIRHSPFGRPGLVTLLQLVIEAVTVMRGS